MHLDRSRVQRKGLDADAHDLLGLQLLEHLVQNTGFGPAIHPRADGVPAPERLGNPRHLQPCSATYNTAFNTCKLHIATLHRQRVLDPLILRLGQFHKPTLTQTPASVNTP